MAQQENTDDVMDQEVYGDGLGEEIEEKDNDLYSEDNYDDYDDDADVDYNDDDDDDNDDDEDYVEITRAASGSKNKKSSSNVPSSGGKSTEATQQVSQEVKTADTSIVNGMGSLKRVTRGGNVHSTNIGGYGDSIDDDDEDDDDDNIVTSTIKRVHIQLDSDEERGNTTQEELTEGSGSRKVVPSSNVVKGDNEDGREAVEAEQNDVRREGDEDGDDDEVGDDEGEDGELDDGTILSDNGEDDEEEDMNGDLLDDQDVVATPTEVEEADEVQEETKRPIIRSKMLMNLLDDNNYNRKVLTEEEIQLRRAENARKRKNLKEKRLEEEKRDTINKLLRKRAGKSKVRSKNPDENDNDEDGESTFVKPRRFYNSHGLIRTIRRKDVDLYCPLK